MIKKSIGLKVFIFPLFLALTVLISVFFIKPAFESMNRIRKTLIEKRKELAVLQAQEQKLSELKKSFESLGKENKDLVMVALPEGENIEDYLDELYQKALKSGVLVSNFAVSEDIAGADSTYTCGFPTIASEGLSPVTSETSSAASSKESGGESNLSPMSSTSPVSLASPSCVRSLGVQISIQGNWDQFLSFYRYLADSNRIANLSQVSISSKNQTSPEGLGGDLLAGQIGLTIYYKPKGTAANQLVIEKLANSPGTGLKQTVLERLEKVIYSPYVEPAVPETGERNFFK